MRLAAQDLEERARWLVAMRWVACAGVFLTVWVASAGTGFVTSPGPLYAIALGMVAYNLVLFATCRRKSLASPRNRHVKAIILIQIALDLIALTLLLYLTDISRNPFVFYFVFHITLASILLPGWTPYLLAALASLLFGGILFLESSGVLPSHALALGPFVPPSAWHQTWEGRVYLGGVLAAFASTLGITVFLTTSMSRYVERVRGQIRQHEKILGIGQLVAGFAHQISNPLDGLQNGLRQLEQAVRGAPRLEETAQLMAKALGRIESVARRLQEFARPHGLELQPCDVNRAVEATLQLFGRSVADRGVLVEQDLAAVHPAWGDPYSIEEILFNLCANALDAMPRGGTLRIRTRNLEHPRIGTDGCVQIDVVDTGVGIPPDQLEKIFEPFYTTKAQSGGTGLGLGLCRMLLSEMGGTLEVESVPARGSTFRILLSAAPAKAIGRTHEDPGR